jgi:3-hydroxy-9,10-secoandrosta-1,3,5(10)-triene-9,17-dione monooxygenase
MYPEQVQEEYWATGANTLCASGLNPAGTTSLTAVTGGYRLSGQWDFASGCDAATWVLVLGAGPAGVLLFLVPRSDFTKEAIAAALEFAAQALRADVVYPIAESSQ